jgi:hypothetical protein
MIKKLEHRTDPLAPRPRFLLRLFWYFLITLVIVSIALLIGMIGYHYCGNLGWLDALHNAAMILTGMGPAVQMTTDSGKIFSIFYALFSGLAFLSMVAIIMTPIIHRFLHRLHLDLDDE